MTILMPARPVRLEHEPDPSDIPPFGAPEPPEGPEPGQVGEPGEDPEEPPGRPGGPETEPGIMNRQRMRGYVWEGYYYTS